MKKLIFSLGLVAILAGCSSTSNWNKEQTCETATLAYTVYQAVVASGHEPSKEEVMAARAAAAFLSVYCGWTTPAAKSGLGDRKWVDSRGVLIVVH